MNDINNYKEMSVFRSIYLYISAYEAVYSARGVVLQVEKKSLPRYEIYISL
jgi:hypothetical protein